MSISTVEPALNFIEFPVPELIEAPIPSAFWLPLTFVPIILMLLWVLPLIRTPLPWVPVPDNSAVLPPILPPEI